MKEKLPVTVVIPAYQARPHLPHAIATIRAQTVDVAEIVVVDDGSTDGGGDVAASLGATVIRQANAGLGPARDAGILAASSPWIALLDADDEWEPDKLRRQWDARAARPGVRLVATDYARYYGKKKLVDSALGTYAAYAGARKTRVADGVVAISAAELARRLPLGQFLGPSTLLVERELAVRVPFGSLVSTRLYHVSEDIEWYLRVIRETDVLVVEAPLMRYQTGGTTLSSNAGRMHYGLLKLAELVAADPGRYAPGSAAAFATDRAHREYLTVRAYLRALDFERAFAALEAFRAKRRSLVLGAMLAAARVASVPPIAAAIRYGLERFEFYRR